MRQRLLDEQRAASVASTLPMKSAALMARASTHSFAPDVFEGMYRGTVQKRNVWLSQYC